MEARNPTISPDNEEDRISNLPDHLIHHIFSFLHMKHAVQSSVLSKRWRFMWTSLTTLNFNFIVFKPPRKMKDIGSDSDGDSDDTAGTDNENDTEEAYVDFVDKVFMFRDSCFIRSCNFYWFSGNQDNEYDITSHVNTWFLGAVKRKVQDLSLKIEIWAYQTYRFPICFFTCKSLTKLELKLGDRGFSEIVLPKSIDLPTLKALTLSGVTIYDGKLTDKLFSGCPILESLIISRSFVTLKNISSQMLKYLKLKYSYQDSEEMETIRLYAPNLISFICKSYMSLDYALEDLSSLVSADILMMAEVDEEEQDESESYSELSEEEKQLYALKMLKYLRALHTVTNLRLSSLFLEVVSEAPNLLASHQPPKFNNLRFLELQTFLSRDCFHTITCLLKIYRNIECLHLVVRKKPWDEPQIYPFIEEVNCTSPNIGDDREAGLSLSCMLYHLKDVMVIGAQGSINELNFFETLLKNAMVLKQVAFYSCECQCPGKMSNRMKKFIEKLDAFPRASSNVEFMFY